MLKKKGNGRAIQAHATRDDVEIPGSPVYQTIGSYKSDPIVLSWYNLKNAEDLYSKHAWGDKRPKGNLYEKYASDIIKLLAEPETYTNNLIRYGGGTLEDHNYEDHSNWRNNITGKADGTFTRPDEIRG